MNSRVDIAVVGGGSAGIAAAITAARAGCSTLLLDQRFAAGGIGGFSGLTTICGLFDDAGQYLVGGFAREFAEAISGSAPLKMGRVWVVPYDPAQFRATAANWCAAETKLTSRWNTLLGRVEVQDSLIVQINGIRVGAVVDCSGTAEVARAIGLECMMTDESTQAPAVIFRLCRVTRELRTAADAASVMMPLARAGIPPVNFQRGREPGTIDVKFSGRIDQVGTLVECLRSTVRGFEDCALMEKPVEPSRRAGRMIIGEYVLTGADVLAGAKFDDGVVRCAWPVEQWNAEGVTRVRYLPSGVHYEIPARSLHSARVKNLFMAGKTISADVDAIASARVMGCCLATGEAAARMAARQIGASSGA